MADKKVIVNLVFGGNQIKEVVLDSVSALPSAAAQVYAGRVVYLNTASSNNPIGIYYHNGTKWVRLATGDEITTINGTLTAHSTAIEALQTATAANGPIWTAINANTNFRKIGSTAYTSFSAATSAEMKTSGRWSFNKNAASAMIELRWKGSDDGTTPVKVAEFDYSAFVKDAFLENVWLIEISGSSSSWTITVLSGGTMDSATQTKVRALIPSGASAGDKFIVFNWKTETAGDPSSSYTLIDVSSLIDTYTQGNGITITNGVIAVKPNATNPSIEVDANGVAVKIKSNAGLQKTSSGLATKVSGRVTADGNGIHLTTTADNAVAAAETAVANGGIPSKNYVDGLLITITEKTAQVSAGTITAGAADGVKAHIIGAHLIDSNQKELVCDMLINNVDGNVTATWNTTGLTSTATLTLRVISTNSIASGS